MVVLKGTSDDALIHDRSCLACWRRSRQVDVVFIRMGAFVSPALLLLSVAQVAICSSPATAQPKELNPPGACSDFATGKYPGSSWTLADCIDVWERFDDSVPPSFRSRVPDIDAWGDTGLVLRRAGSPCMVKAAFNPDGAGSTTMRNFATWIFSEEMGCDWVTPVWSGRKMEHGNGTTTVYCHQTATVGKADLVNGDLAKYRAALRATSRCTVIDWLLYFQFNVPSIAMPDTGVLKVVEVRRAMPKHPTRSCITSRVL